MIYAALFKSMDILKYLIECLGANTEVIGKYDKTTPLHNACYCNNVEVVKYLLSKNANVKAINSQNLTPYQIAVKRGHSEIVAIFENL